MERSRKTHPRAAAAPRKAYVPGVMHGASGAQLANQAASGYVLEIISRQPVSRERYSRVHCFDKDPDHSAKVRPDSHGRDEDSTRDFAAVRNDDEGGSDDGGQK
jgi:hypothetical protein